MKDFDQQLLRLKQTLNTTEDQQVAAMLGLSKAAFAARKKRDAFPGDLLATLSLERPELGIDVHWVMHGRTQRQAAVEAAAGVAILGRQPATVAREASPTASPASHFRPANASDTPVNALPPLTADEHQLLWQLRMCDPHDQLVVQELVKTLLQLRRGDQRPEPGPSKKG